MKSITANRVHFPSALFGNSGRRVNRFLKETADLKARGQVEIRIVTVQQTEANKGHKFGGRTNGIVLGRLEKNGIQFELICFGPTFEAVESAKNWSRNRNLGTPEEIAVNLKKKKAA